MAAGPLRVGLVCDLREESWPSMDLVADRLEHHLRVDHEGEVAVGIVRPVMPRRLSRVGGPALRFRDTVDRLLGRYLDYPRHLDALGARFDVTHVLDHSYAHLVSHLPADRTVVTCHDLDAFQTVLVPCRHGNPVLRALARRTLRGLRAAARVVCDTAAVRDQLLDGRLVVPDRLRVVPLGVHPTRSPLADPAADAAAERWLGPAAGGTIDLLHVGSTIPRKRIDRLLEVFAAVAARRPELRLVRVGGAFTPAQAAMADRLGVASRIVVMPWLDEAVISAVYRRATLLLLPSDAEGFGLPLVEALASGTPAVASDLAVLREVGGEAVSYCPPGRTGEWTRTIEALLDERETRPARWAERCDGGIRHAVRFSWRTCADWMVDVYRGLVAHPAATGGSARP